MTSKKTIVKNKKGFIKVDVKRDVCFILALAFALVILRMFIGLGNIIIAMGIVIIYLQINALRGQK